MGYIFVRGTLLSRAKSRDKIQLLNFNSDTHVVVNNKAKEAMEKMRAQRLLNCDHPLSKMTGRNVCLFNIRSWNLHIDHFLSNKIYTSKICLLCFTETGNNSQKRIEDNVGLES